MNIQVTPTYRALAAGAAAAAILIGAFAIGFGTGHASAAPQRGAAPRVDSLVSSASSQARITVTGTGTVSGTPNQLVLSMGVQVNAPSVGSALAQANHAVRRVTTTLRARGVAAADIQTSGLSIQPNYQASSQTVVGYGISESLNATLRRLAAAGSQIQAAVAAGGNATTVDGISLNLTDTSSLLARARAAAIRDARVKATQYASALGEPLGPVVSVSEQTPSQPLPVFNSVAGTSSRAVPISPGTQQLSVSVTVVYGL